MSHLIGKIKQLVFLKISRIGLPIAILSLAIGSALFFLICWVCEITRTSGNFAHPIKLAGVRNYPKIYPKRG